MKENIPIPREKFAMHTGVELVTVSEGRAVTRLELTPQHHNAAGFVHGGAVFTLADTAFGIASNSHGKEALALNISISFMKALKEGVLYAEAREISRGNRIANYIIEVKDSNETLVASCQGIVYFKGTPDS